MKRALLVTTVSGFVPQFEMNNVKILQDMGYEVHYASNFKTPVYTDNNERLNGTGILCHPVDFVRSPFKVKENSHAYKQLLQIMNKEEFQIIHCHTPMGGVLARIAAHKINKKKQKKMRVIYTAHGFHFYKNAGLLKWMCFYPVERYLARWTDALLTINKEDYNRAKKWIDKQKVYYIPGVGIGLENENIGSEKIREEFGIKKDDILYVSVGELTKRKNHVVVINAICNMVKKQKNIYYLICGSGKLEGKLKNKIEKMGLEKNVILTGYRTDVESILAAADVFVFPSHQEGLPVALLEAMKMGLPVVCSKIRGNVDLIKDGEGGYLVKDRKTESQYEKKMETLYRNETLRKKMGKINRKNIKKYEISQVEKRMKTVYRNIEESWMEEWEKY